MKTLTALYDSFYTPPQTTDAHAEIEALHKQLILKLAKPERRLVLRLIDAKDHLAEEKSIDSFTCGFRLAWRLANELNSYPRTRASHPVRTDRAGRPCRAAGAMEPPRQGGYTSRAQTTPCWPLCARLWASLRRRIGRAGKQPEFPTSYGRYSGRTRYTSVGSFSGLIASIFASRSFGKSTVPCRSGPNSSSSATTSS